MALETDQLYPEFDVAQFLDFSLGSIDLSSLDLDIFASLASPDPLIDSNCHSAGDVEQEPDSTETDTQEANRSTSTTAVNAHVSVVPLLPAKQPQQQEVANRSTKGRRKQWKVLFGNNKFGRAGCRRCIQCRRCNKKVISSFWLEY